MQREPITSLFTLRFTAILYGNLIFFSLFFCIHFFFKFVFRKTASIYFGILFQNFIQNKSDHCWCPSPTFIIVILLLIMIYVVNVSVWNQELINIFMSIRRLI